MHNLNDVLFVIDYRQARRGSSVAASKKADHFIMTKDTNSPPDKQLLLEKLTLHYLPTEDRIRMDAQVQGGGVLVFWLTLRLCRELVKVLTEYFDKQTLPKVQGSKKVVQSFFQQDADRQRNPVPSVERPSPTTRSQLVSEVNIRTNQHAILLRMPLGGGEAAILPMNPTEARQWLQILYEQFQRAQWPLEAWPEWIRKTHEQIGDSSAVH